MGADRKSYDIVEVSQHNHREDSWVVIGGKVYDVTKFLKDHPGGDVVLLAATGKDATDEFEAIGHSTSARAMLDEFYIGDIDSASIPIEYKYKPPKQPQNNQDNTAEFFIRILQFLVPLVILGAAAGIHFYTKST